MSEFDKMVAFLDNAWTIKDMIVPCLVGPPGIGKTAAVRQHAKNVGAGQVVTIIASQILPNEVSGITMPDTETRSMEIYDHFRLSRLKDGDILFFDELLEADQLVLSACLTLIESRQMMSGRLLPDIQIIAATNPTIKPNMLKDNIKQRFWWRSFDVDRNGCREYLKATYGFDPGDIVVQSIVETGQGYNILTQRDLTKMVAWMSRARNKEDAEIIAREINNVWKNNIGTHLMKAFLKDHFTKVEIQEALQYSMRMTGVTVDDVNNLKEGIGDIINDAEAFEQSSLAEVMETLKQLPEWNEFERMLNQIHVYDSSTIEF